MKQHLPTAATLFCATVLILLPALYNGFPLVYSDTGTYLRSAFIDYVPPDRPYWYGGFIRSTSLGGWSLWGPVVAQAFLCAVLLWALWRRFGSGRRVPFLITVGVLAWCTGLGWYASQLVPDIFTALGAMAGLLLIAGRLGLLANCALALLLIFACWVHLSNVAIMPLVLLVSAIAAHRAGIRIPRSRAIPMAGLLIAAWPLSRIAVNSLIGQEDKAGYTHVFLMGRLAETGILEAWLDEYCDTERYGICVHRDSLPTTSREFLWSDRSPLVWQGGQEAVRREYQAILLGTLSDPRYLAMHVRASLQGLLGNLAITRVGDELENSWYRDPGSPPHYMIAENVPAHLPAFRAARQNTGDGRLGLYVVDRIHPWILILSCAGWIVLLSPWGRGRRGAHGLVLLVFGMAAVVIAAWVCGTLSTVDTRFMARTAWLLPWCVAVVMSRGPDPSAARKAS